MNLVKMNNFVIGLLTAFTISVAGAMTLDWKDQAVQGTILEQNTQAIRELTQAVRDLQIKQATDGERFITRSEFETKLKENHNGS